MNDEEREIIDSKEECKSEEIEELEKCKEFEEEMIKYKPEGRKMKKLEKKYKEH